MNQHSKAHSFQLSAASTGACLAPPARDSRWALARRSSIALGGVGVVTAVFCALIWVSMQSAAASCERSVIPVVMSAVTPGDSFAGQSLGECTTDSVQWLGPRLPQSQEKNLVLAPPADAVTSSPQPLSQMPTHLDPPGALGSKPRNGSACSAIEIDLPSSHSGLFVDHDCSDPLDSSRNADLYTLELDSVWDITIDLRSFGFLANLRLLNESGVQLLAVGDAGDGAGSRISRLVGAGTYQIVATSIGHSDTGSYTLTIAGQEPVRSGRQGDSTEESASSCSVTDVGLPLSQTESLSSGDCVDTFGSGQLADLYRVELGAPTDITIELQSDHFNTYLRLLDATGAQVVADDNGGGDTNSRISRLAGPGTYQIAVTGVGRHDTGAYTLTIADREVALGGRQDDPSEGSATSCSADSISIPSIRNATLSEDDCPDRFNAGNYADRYRFTLESHTEVVIHLESNDHDSLLRLLDDAGNEIVSDEDSGRDRNSRIQRGLAAGEYQIVATNQGSPSTGEYRLTIYVPARALVCHVNSIGSLAGVVERSGELGIGNCTSEHSGRQHWADVYSFSLAQASVVTFDLTSTDIDPVLALIDADGILIKRDDDGGSGRNARLVRELPTGQYQLEATKHDAPEGSYHLRISVQQLPAISGNCPAMGIGSPSTQSGSLSAEDCADPFDSGKYADRYRIRIESQTEVTISMDSDDFDPFLRLLDATGAELDNDDDGGDGRNSRIQYIVSAGDYEIVASHFGELMTGDYRFSIASPEAADACLVPLGDMLDHWTERSGQLRRGDCTYEHNGWQRLADEYSFALPEAATVTFDLISSEIDPALALLNADGNLILRDNDGGDGANARIELELPAGRYRIVATQYDTSTGSYQLQISVPTSSPFGEACAVADIVIPADESGSIAEDDCSDPLASGTEADLYRFELGTRTDVMIELQSVGFNTLLRLLDDHGRELATDDSVFSVGSSHVRRTLDAGVYRIVVASVFSRDVGRYFLEVTGSPPVSTCSEQPLGTLTTTVERLGQLEPGDCISRHSGEQENADIYSFSLDRPTRVSVTLSSPSLDAVLTLSRADGTFIALEQDLGPGPFDTRLTRDLDPGDYLIEATQRDSAPGPYDLLITLRPAWSVSDTCSIQLLSVPADLSESLRSGECLNPTYPSRPADRFRFELSEPTDISVEVESTDFKPGIHLLDRDGQLLGSDEQALTDSSYRIWKRLDPGTYQLAVAPIGAQEVGDYRLKFKSGEVRMACPVTSLGRAGATIQRSGQLESGDCNTLLGEQERSADFYTFTLDQRSTVTIEMTSIEVDPLINLTHLDGSLIERNDDGGYRLNSRISRDLPAGEYRLEASQYSQSAGAYRLNMAAAPFSEEDSCRTVGPVGNGIAFPQREVTLTSDSSTVFRVSGVRNFGGTLTYIVCVDDRALTDIERDQAIFAAGYYYSTDASVDPLVASVIEDGYDTAVLGYGAYQDRYRDQALAQTVQNGLNLMDYVLFAATLPHLSVPALVSRAAIRGFSLQIEFEQDTLQAISEHREDIVVGLAWGHVRHSYGIGPVWTEHVDRKRTDGSRLFYQSAVYAAELEEQIAAGAAGAALEWAIAESNKRAWQRAVLQAFRLIPFGVGTALASLVGPFGIDELLDRELLDDADEWFEDYEPYRSLRDIVRSSNQLVSIRQDQLIDRLGLDAGAILPWRTSSP